MKTLLTTIVLLICAAVGSADAAPTNEELYVEVLGQVSRPGKILWSPDLTVASAILRCGGIAFRPPARTSILRGNERIRISVKAILLGKEADVKLQPGDVLDLTVQPREQTSPAEP